MSTQTSDSHRGFGTRAVHAGLSPDPSFGSVIPAIHQTSTFAQPRPGEFVEDYDYARSANPTRAALEQALGELEGGHAVAFSSGMAAEHALITAVGGAGAHIVLPADLYGGTYRLVDKIMTRWGLSYDLVDQSDPDALARAVRDDTRLIWVETPTNPRLDVIDIDAVVARPPQRAGGGRQHVRDARQPEPARPRRRLRRALDDQIPRRSFGRCRRRRDRGDRDCYERLRFVQNSVGAVPARSTASSFTAACARCT